MRVQNCVRMWLEGALRVRRRADNRCVCRRARRRRLRLHRYLRPLGLSLCIMRLPAKRPNVGCTLLQPFPR